MFSVDLRWRGGSLARSLRRRMKRRKRKKRRVGEIEAGS
jgi:hypothetical protein